MGINENVNHFINDGLKGEAEGRGGMLSKLNYAKQSARKNIPTIIANGKSENTIIDIIDGKAVGTKVEI